MTGTATKKPPRYRTESVHYAPSPDQSKRPERVLLQRTASRNIRRHWLRGVFRVAVLITTDVAVLTVLRGILEAVTESGIAVAEFARAVLPQEFLTGWPFTFAAVLSLLVVGSYGPGEKRRDIGRLMAASSLAAALTVYHLVWLESLLAVSLSFGAVTMLCWMVLTVSRRTLDALLRWLVPRVGAHRVVTVCDGESDWFDPSMQNMGRGAGGSSLRVVGTVSTSSVASNDNGALLRQLGVVIDRCKGDTVLVCGPLSDREFDFVVDTTLVAGCKLLAAPRTAAAAGIEPKPVCIDGVPLVELTAPSLKAWQLALKRVLDVLGASLGLLIVSPVLAGIALWVRLDSPGPAVFRQIRLGARGKTFRCFKFRSMRADAEAVLRSDPDLYTRYVKNHFKLPEERDPRLTRAGQFLRRTSLDELPQLINVLKGDMSLVGPRPIVPEELEHYDRSAPLFLSIKPGMTGAWAVSGRSRVGYPDRARMELEYVRRWSLLSDFGILLRTVPAVLRRRGAH